MTQLFPTISLFVFNLLLIGLLMALIIKPGIMLYSRSDGESVWVKVGFSWPAFFSMDYGHCIKGLRSSVQL